MKIYNRSNISDYIGKVFDIDFTKKRLRLSEIKNILALSKKWKLCYTFMANNKARKPSI